MEVYEEDARRKKFIEPKSQGGLGNALRERGEREKGEVSSVQFQAGRGRWGGRSRMVGSVLQPLKFERGRGLDNSILKIKKKK